MGSNLYTNKEKNNLKTALIMVLFLILITALGWFFGFYYQEPSILFFAIVLALVMNVGSYWFSDKLALSISGAKEADINQYKELYRVLENLCITAGLLMPRLYIIDDSQPNAFATGRNQKHAAIAVTTGLLNVLDRSELEGVLAHELAHIGNKDILLQSVIVVLVGFVTLLADFFLRTSHRRSSDDNKVGGVIMIIGLVLVILSPLIATFIQLAVSRQREFLADSTGSLITRYPEGLANALRKISVVGKEVGSLSKANHATAHMFIISPFASSDGDGKINWFEKMFLTHPPVEERIRALLG